VSDCPACHGTGQVTEQEYDEIIGMPEKIAETIAAYAANYPEDVFPEQGISVDAISGTAMRHAYRNAARLVREMSWPP
jgi:excinuclease UvrABC ATPase subunit